MTEGRKTGVFAIIASVVGLLVWVTTAKNKVDQSVRDRMGAVLFEKFKDPLEAASLRIVRFDEGKQATVDFEVAKDQKSGLWSIPSRESYPADAQKQMADAATLFVGLKALDVASEKRADQELYGVLEPSTQREQGGEGVGMLVRMRDAKGDLLVDVIVGKETDDKKRFLRIPSEDVIYVADLDTQPLSTDFKKWIEDDLLKLSSTDIEFIGIQDYQLVPTNQGISLVKNYDADIKFVSANGQWEPVQIFSYGPEGKVERKLTDTEQLSATRLNDIKSTLDRLKLADVAKKPAGLAADLKADRSKLSLDARESLAKRGFFPDPQSKEGDVVDFFAENGELVVTLKNGVQYLLRFGGSAGADMSQQPDKGEESKISINRYLLVTCRLDESRIPVVELEKIPETVEELKAMDALQKAAENPVPVVPPVTPSTNLESPETATPQADNPQTEPKKDESPVGDKPADQPAEAPKEPETKIEPPKEEPKDPNKSVFQQNPNSTVLVRALTQETLQEDKPAEKPASEASQNAGDTTPATPPNSTEPQANQELTEQEWKERLEAKREAITKSNQRKIEERDEKLKMAKSKVAELNRRFADWYYIISEEDYTKLKVKLEDLIQTKTTP